MDQDLEEKTELDQEQLSTEQAILLATGDLILSCGNEICIILSEYLDNLEKSASALQLQDELIRAKRFSNEHTAKGLLTSNLGFQICFILWRESSYVSDGALAKNRHVRNTGKQGRGLTQNALSDSIGKRMGLDPAQAKCISQLVSRICDAMRIYGLLHRDESRPTYKPISGTSRLNSLMSLILSRATDLIATQLTDEEEDDHV